MDSPLPVRWTGHESMPTFETAMLSYHMTLVLEDTIYGFQVPVIIWPSFS